MWTCRSLPIEARIISLLIYFFDYLSNLEEFILIKLIIWDLDGTTADTLESLAHSVNICMRKHNLAQMPIENFRFYAGDGARTMLERCLKDAGDKDGQYLDQVFEEYCQIFHKGCTYRVKSFEGLPETLENLKNYGVLLAICSNKAQPYAEAVVEKIYGKDTFNYILGEQEGIPRKPAADGVLKIAEDLGVDPDECVYIGDTNTDMKTGKAAGMYTIGVTWGFRSREELEQYEPDLIINRPEELLELPL
jgi:phosphoglycolate phosphatase